MILISACLTGNNCRYDGRSNLKKEWLDILAGKNFIPVCPEQLGGLATPRDPAELTCRNPLTVKTGSGKDLTDAFIRGAEEIVKIARKLNVSIAILKERSPSCGCCFIYDGAFSGKLIPGKGVTAEKLSDSGVKLYSDEELERFIMENSGI